MHVAGRAQVRSRRNRRVNSSQAVTPIFTAFPARTLGIRMLSPTQLTFCRVVFDRVDPSRLDAADRERAAEMLGDVDTIPPTARGVLAAFKGARTGFPGSWGCSLFLFFSGLTCDLRSLALGEHGFGVIVAPDLRPEPRL